jgi:AraC family transcriptional activator of mtrCDE
MTRTLLKQVLVMLFRRGGRSGSGWIRSLTPLGDPQIARAFAEMVANPGAPHTVQSLSRLAALSRSSFMARFHSVLGRSPMTVLRQLRMRQAEDMLGSNLYSIDQIAYQVGYANRSSFARAYRQASGQQSVRKV